MAHFKAHFHAMTESTSNNSAVNMKIMTITLQSEANGIFGKEKVTQQRTGERKRAVSKKVTQQKKRRRERVRKTERNFRVFRDG